KNIYAWMVVCEFDKLPDIDAKVICDERQLVREGNVDVSERVLSQFRHFGGNIVSWQQFRFAESCINSRCALGRFFSLSSNNAVIGSELFHRFSRKDPLRAVREVNYWFVCWVVSAVSY